MIGMTESSVTQGLNENLENLIGGHSDVKIIGKAE